MLRPFNKFSHLQLSHPALLVSVEHNFILNLLYWSAWNTISLTAQERST